MDSATDMEFLLGVVRCPRTGQKLLAASGHLVTEDGRFSYPVEQGIPVLLPGEAIEVKP